jgi:phosphatidylglycerophosphatase A
VAATGLGSGRLRPAPGTWGSLAALGAWCLLSVLLATPFSTWVLGHRAHPSLASYIYGVEVLFLLVPLAMTWLALRASSLVLRETRAKDPGGLVAGQWAGMWITLWPMRWEIAQNLPRLVAPGWWRWLPALLVPFLVFRLLDSWKPWPVRQVQALPGGDGIVADHVVAGLYGIPIVMLGAPMVLHALANYLR